MSWDELGLEAQIDSMAEQCRRVYIDWETAVRDRNAALAEVERQRTAIDKIHSADRYGCCADDGHSWPCPTILTIIDRSAG